MLVKSSQFFNLPSQLLARTQLVVVGKETPDHKAPVNVSVVFVLLAVAFFVISKVVEFVIDRTLVFAGIPVPLIFISADIALVLSIVTVASPLVVSQVPSLELGKGKVTKVKAGEVFNVTKVLATMSLSLSEYLYRNQLVILLVVFPSKNILLLIRLIETVFLLYNHPLHLKPFELLLLSYRQ